LSRTRTRSICTSDLVIHSHCYL